MQRLFSRPLLFLSLLVLFCGAVWFTWPWLRPWLLPTGRGELLVVLDGNQRFDHALALQRDGNRPILLIACPVANQPSAAQRARVQGTLLELREGFDTATQMAALARWLQQRPSRPRRLLLVTDAFHSPRATTAAQIAAGSLGVKVIPMPVEPVSLGSAAQEEANWPLWRDGLRLKLWRMTGSTGAALRPAIKQAKVRQCYGE